MQIIRNQLCSGLINNRLCSGFSVDRNARFVGERMQHIRRHKFSPYMGDPVNAIAMRECITFANKIEKPQIKLPCGDNFDKTTKPIAAHLYALEAVA